MRFALEGAERFRSVLNLADLEHIRNAVSEFPPDRAGIRLHGITALHPYLSAHGRAGGLAQVLLGERARPVRALLFDKNSLTNWKVGWHQDRTIVVRRRVETQGFGPWSVKAGLQHVTPPFDLLARMITLRVHLDPVDAGNAPLLVAPGSHRWGRIPESEIAGVVEKCGTAACLAEAGDIWLYATPILHASEPATAPTRRRVLQVDYSADELPPGLEWLGV